MKTIICKISFVQYSQTSVIVPGIKALRNATGYGLKEAKDIADAIRNSGTPPTVRFTPEQFGLLQAYLAMEPTDIFNFSHIKVEDQISNEIDVARQQGY